MSTAYVSLYGRYSLKNTGDYVWHELHNNTPGYAGVQPTGSLTFSRDPSSTTISCSGTIGNTLRGSSPFYGFPVLWALVRGGTQHNANNAGDHQNVYITGGSVLAQGSMSAPGSGAGAHSETSINTSITSSSNEEIYVCYMCQQTGGCQAGYSGTGSSPNSAWVIVGILNTADIPYNPYTPPTPPTSHTVNKTRVKPDGNATITWSDESGGTYGIDHFQIEASIWRGGSQIYNYTRVSDYLYYSGTGYNPANYTVDIDNLREYNNSTRSWGNYIKVRPGDVLQFYLVTYEGTTGTLISTQVATNSNNNNIDVYKDGLVRYKNNSGTIYECTKGYYKDSGGTIRKLRYSRVKDSGGNIRIIDVYTTKYE